MDSMQKAITDDPTSKVGRFLMTQKLFTQSLQDVIPLSFLLWDSSSLLVPMSRSCTNLNIIRNHPGVADRCPLREAQISSQRPRSSTLLLVSSLPRLNTDPISRLTRRVRRETYIHPNITVKCTGPNSNPYQLKCQWNSRRKRHRDLPTVGKLGLSLEVRA